MSFYQQEIICAQASGLVDKDMTEISFNADLHPRCQPKLIGHGEAYEKLQSTFQSGSMPPAWLLIGEKGIGKATLAYRFARFVLSHEQPDSSFIDRQIMAHTYPNLLTIEREADEDGKIPREISVEQARSAGPFLRQSAAIPGWRVVIIDAANELNRNAANSLLKVLEEPPSKTLFLLIAHSLGQVLPTVRSRCCQLALQPLRAQDLETVFGKDDILSLAQGSIGQALQLKRAGGTELLSKVVRAIAQAVQGQYAPLQSFAASIPKGDPSFDLILTLLESCIYQIIIKGSDLNGDLSKLAPLRPASHWSDVGQCLRAFFSIAKTSHLDQSHLLMAAFFIIENPRVGEDFVHGASF